ncbi:hypothetical protein BACCAP_01059 [Pseudoflavonifractor capillosus ATCC 29799]|uniref:Uncharacterized protein n=1 Tax=Pseudoflavonifractor capillosus ATCC 29799 TaxID=411467 RepID=A6NS80_9FIRM|nr:hypothetical protein BACCAP_01059 [Pseudoflavonifractor capillosus ATCC 29799]
MSSILVILLFNVFLIVRAKNAPCFCAQTQYESNTLNRFHHMIQKI